MPQDYNIYIHSTFNASDPTENTKPFETRANNPIAQSFNSFNNANNFIGTDNEQSPDTAGVGNLGFSSLKKILPKIAIPIAIAKTIDKIVSTGLEHLEEYTGNYQSAMEYNNVKIGIKNILNPIEYINYNLKRDAQMRKTNQMIKIQNTLIGHTLKDKIGV